MIGATLRGHRPMSAGDWLFGCYALLAAVGVALVAFGPWRSGTGLVSAALLLASVTRLVLPEDKAGLLRVRRRLVDVGALAMLGAAAMVLTLVIPNLPAS